MHRSSGRAYHTVGGSRTAPWYNFPTPMGVPKIDPSECTATYPVTAPDGSTYYPTIECGTMPPGTHVPPFTAWGLWLFGRTQMP
jgi:hypothetical protein